MARERLAAGEASVLESGGVDLDAVDAQKVAVAGMAGDTLSVDIVRQVARKLGVGIVSLLYDFDPEVIAIGGGGMSAGLDLLLPGIARDIQRRGMAHQLGRLRVVKSELGNDVSLLGAEVLVFEGQVQG